MVRVIKLMIGCQGQWRAGKKDPQAPWVVGSKGRTPARGQCTAKGYYNIETSLIIRNKHTVKDIIEQEFEHSALVLIDVQDYRKITLWRQILRSNKKGRLKACLFYYNA